MHRAPLVTIVWLLFLSGCSIHPRDLASPPNPARVNHTVFFTLKNPADAADLIADCNTKAAAIPGVVSAYAGRPLDTGRANVNRDYDVAFYAGFKSEAAYRAYLAHPSHAELIQAWRPRWERVQIYDVLDE